MLALVVKRALEGRQAGRRGALAGPLTLLLAAGAPFAAAAAWMPIRQGVPNTDLALGLVVMVMGLGWLARRPVVLVAAVSASFWFEFFDARPYGTLFIAHELDVETTLVLFVAAVVTGELAVEFSRHRSFTRRRAADLSSVQETAALLASGEEVATVLEVVAAQLVRLLGLSDCRFDAADVNSDALVVSREGGLSLRAGPAAAPARPTRAALPVWGQGDILGYYSIEWGDEPPGRDGLLVAITLADQAGAALMAQAPPPAPPGAERGGSPRLRVLSSRRAVSGGAAGLGRHPSRALGGPDEPAAAAG